MAEIGPLMNEARLKGERDRYKERAEKLEGKLEDAIAWTKREEDAAARLAGQFARRNENAYNFHGSHGERKAFERTRRRLEGLR